MKRFGVVTAVLLAVVLSGCATPLPQTAEEFRKAAPGAFMGKVETYKVNRSFRTVAKTLQKNGPKCLDVRIKTTSQSSRSYHVVITKYNPTVIVTKKRAELHLQQKHEKGVVGVRKEPEKGHYLLVVDATPIGKKKTRIDMYYPSMGFGTLIKAIKGWTTGKNLGCPDLTK